MEYCWKSSITFEYNQMVFASTKKLEILYYPYIDKLLNKLCELSAVMQANGEFPHQVTA